jgi:hypothetical protein
MEIDTGRMPGTIIKKSAETGQSRENLVGFSHFFTDKE